MAIEDVTKLAHRIRDAVQTQQQLLPEVPEEQVYHVSPELQKILAMREIPNTAP